MIANPLVSYTDPSSSRTIARPNALIAATTPSIRSLLRGSSGAQFRARSVDQCPNRCYQPSGR